MKLIKIASLAGLRRAISTPNVSIHVVDHWQEHLRGTIRKPGRMDGRKGIQSNGYWFVGDNRDGKRCDMWADTPKASLLRFNEDGSVTYHPDTSMSWTIRFEEQEMP